MSEQQKLTLDKFRREWKNFKNMRDKKKFQTYEEEGWLSFMRRENMLDFVMELFENENLTACG